MRKPESNSLVQIAGGKPPRERGFNCMQLIKFLTDDNVKEWDEWHGAHVRAASGCCPYASKCHIYARSIEKLGKKPVQLQLF